MVDFGGKIALSIMLGTSVNHALTMALLLWEFNRANPAQSVTGCVTHRP
jgi:hypothetical protein